MPPQRRTLLAAGGSYWTVFVSADPGKLNEFLLGIQGWRGFVLAVLAVLLVVTLAFWVKVAGGAADIVVKKISPTTRWLATSASTLVIVLAGVALLGSAKKAEPIPPSPSADAVTEPVPVTDPEPLDEPATVTQPAPPKQYATNRTQEPKVAPQPRPAASTQKSDKARVLVLPFENAQATQIEVEGLSSEQRNSLRDHYATVARSLLEDIVVNTGVARAVERKQQSALLDEMQRQAVSSIYDPASVAEVGRQLGASHVLIGSFLRVSAMNTDAMHDDRRIRTTELLATLRVRMVDVETGEIVFSKTPNARKVYMKPKQGVRELGDTAYEVTDIALRNLAESKQFLESLMP